MSGSPFEFRSNLATTPLAEVLQTVHRYRVSGVVDVVCRGVSKKIFIWNGDVVFATSDDIEESLGRFLLARNLISKRGYEESTRLLMGAKGMKRHGEVLVGMGLLTPARLHAVVFEQVKSIVTAIFEWEEGAVTFVVGEYRADELIQLKIPTRHMILEGVKAIRDVRRIVNSLGPSWTVFTPCYAPAEIGDVGLSPGEVDFLGLVDGIRTLRQLAAAGSGDAAQNAKLVYAFATLKLITRKEPNSGVKKLQWKSPRKSF